MTNFTQRRRALAAVLTVTAVAAAAPAASAATRQVSSQQEFRAAVSRAASGDVIELANGRYDDLAIEGRRFSPDLTVVGGKGAQVGDFTIARSSGLRLRGFSVVGSSNRGRPVQVKVRASSDVTMENLRIDGIRQSWGANIDIEPDSANITLRDSELTECGEDAACLWPSGRNVRVLDNRFHDTHDSDMIKGATEGALIQGNTFERAVRGTCVDHGTLPEGGSANCNHNDIIQIMGGGPWTIRGNSFGERNGGTAQIYVQTAFENGSHDIEVRNNVFSGDAGLFAIQMNGGVGERGGDRPRGIVITDNTILSGSSGAFRLFGWEGVNDHARPLIERNTLALNDPSMCRFARFEANRVQRGAPCPGDGRA